MTAAGVLPAKRLVVHTPPMQVSPITLQTSFAQQRSRLAPQGRQSWLPSTHRPPGQGSPEVQHGWNSPPHAGREVGGSAGEGAEGGGGGGRAGTEGGGVGDAGGVTSTGVLPITRLGVQTPPMQVSPTTLHTSFAQHRLRLVPQARQIWLASKHRPPGQGLSVAQHCWKIPPHAVCGGGSGGGGGSGPCTG